MFSCISGNWSTRDIQILDRKKCIFIPGKPPWQLCQCIQRIPFQGWVILMSILILIWHLKPPIKKEVICSLIPRPFLSTIWSNIGVDLSHHLHCYQSLTSIILNEIELTMVCSFTANWLYWLHRTLKLNMNCDPFVSIVIICAASSVKWANMESFLHLRCDIVSSQTDKCGLHCTFRWKRRSTWEAERHNSWKIVLFVN